MGIKVHALNMKTETLTYEVIPEEVPISLKNKLSDYKKINEECNGYSKERTLRHVGRVPFSFMYNYAVSKGVPSHQLGEYFSVDKGKNMKLLLKEFNCFKMVDKL